MSHISLLIGLRRIPRLTYRLARDPAQQRPPVVAGHEARQIEDPRLAQHQPALSTMKVRLRQFCKSVATKAGLV